MNTARARAAARLARDPGTRRFRIVLVTSLVVLAACMLLSLVIGRYDLGVRSLLGILADRVVDLPASWRTWSAGDERLLFSIRLPRLLGAVLVGAALSLSGATYQGVFRNPLVSPDILGVAQGASVGAAGAILLGRSPTGIAIAALGCGLLAVLLATSIPRILRNDSTLMLVLSGVIVGGFATAVVGALKFVADPETQLASITFWQMGSLASVRQDSLLRSAILAIPCVIGLLLIRWRVNVLALGDADARSLGLHLRRDRGIAILLATVLTAASVCLAGTVGWVGLVVPHLCRLLVGPDNSRVMPLAVTVGAAFLVLADTLARSLTAAEIPLGVVTGFVGAPLYLALLVFGRVRVR